MKELTIDEKKEKFMNLSLNEDNINSIFYTTRNLKINEILNFIENYFQNLDFDVSAKWKESSFGNPSLVIEYQEKNKNFKFEYSFYIERKTMIKNDKISQLIYILDPKLRSDYYPYKLSQQHLLFLSALKNQDFMKALTDKVNLCNYPFDKILPEDEKAKLSEQVSFCSILEMFDISKQSSFINLSYNVRNYLKQNGFSIFTEFNNNFLFLNFKKFNTSVKINLEHFDVDINLKLNKKFHSFKDIEIFKNNNSKSKKLNDFILFVNSKEFEKFIKNAILGTNYPFDRPFHSGF